MFSYYNPSLCPLKKALSHLGEHPVDLCTLRLLTTYLPLYYWHIERLTTCPFCKIVYRCNTNPDDLTLKQLTFWWDWWMLCEVFTVEVVSQLHTHHCYSFFIVKKTNNLKALNSTDSIRAIPVPSMHYNRISHKGPVYCFGSLSLLTAVRFLPPQKILSFIF